MQAFDDAAMLPRFDALSGKWPELIVQRSFTPQQLFSGGELASEICCVSMHQPAATDFGDGKPAGGGASTGGLSIGGLSPKLRAIRCHLEEHRSIKLLWIEGCCTSQDAPSSGWAASLRLFLASSVLVCVERPLLCDARTLLEAWLAMQSVDTSGRIGPSDGRRAKVVAMQVRYPPDTLRLLPSDMARFLCIHPREPRRTSAAACAGCSRVGTPRSEESTPCFVRSSMLPNRLATEAQAALYKRLTAILTRAREFSSRKSWLTNWTRYPRRRM